ncbi:MAG: acyltransferase [Candidatus Acidiferrum sp.]
MASVQSAVPSEGRIPELDGLRGLAILLVILCHYIANSQHASLGFWLHHLLSAFTVGWSGVDLFFVLSGFLIGGILLDARGSPSYFGTFYLRRVHRILPIYYAWLILYIGVVVGAVLFFHGRSSITGRDLAAVPYYFVFLQNVIYAPTPFQWEWLVVTWSLAVEEQFYLLAPPLIRFLSVRRLVIVLGTVICAAPLLRLFAFRYLTKHDYLAQMAMPCRADALALGILAAVAWRWPAFRGFLKRHPGVLQRTFAYMMIGLTVLLWWLVRPISVVTVTIGYSWLAGFYTCLLLLVLSQPEGVVAQVMRWRWLRELGGISYGVYLIHLTINMLAHKVLLNSPPSISNLEGLGVTMLALCVTLFLAGLSWRFFEKPLIRRGHRYTY